MKKLPLILSVVSLAAVIFIFILDFTEKDKEENTSVSGTIENTSPGGIAYVELDSVLVNFDMFHELSDELLAKTGSADAELSSKASQWEARMKDFEERSRKQLETRATLAQMQQALLQEQQEIVNFRDQVQYNLMEEEQVMQRSLLDYLMKYLEVYNQEKNYDYILSKTFGGAILNGKEGLDITQDVLIGLNEYYRTENK